MILDLIFAGLTIGVFVGIVVGIASVLTTTVCRKCRETYSNKALRCPHCGHLPASK